MMVNRERLMDYKEYLDTTTDYLPLILISYVGLDYFKRVDDNVLDKYYINRTALQGAEDYNEFIENDIKAWLMVHPEFEDLFEL